MTRTDLDATLCVQKNVIGLDVTVDDGLTMQMAQAFARLEAAMRPTNLKTIRIAYF